MSLMLEMRDVTKVFGGGFMRGPGKTALNKISFAISNEKPTITAVAGESGSGKTTLARMLLGFMQPTSGAVFYQGRDIRGLKGKQRSTFRREVQAILQDPFESFNPFYKVDHVLSLPISKFGLASSGEEAREMMEGALRSVGLRPADTLGRYPHQLSGGQRQRVMVARTVLLRPRVILADEPVSMVDASLRAAILESLLKLHQEQGISILYITHDLNTAYQVGDNILVLYRGSVVEAGGVESVIQYPQHPYTQLLVNSIPAPSTETRWRDDDLTVKSGDPALADAPPGGCAFASRCPHVMPECREAVPPFFMARSDHAAACYLYSNKAQTTGRQLSAMYPQEEEAAASTA